MSEEVQMLMLVCSTAAFLGLLRFIRGFFELKRERGNPTAINGVEDRLERIEAAVESTAIEVERISEANRFMARLLADRAGAAILPSPPERVTTPH